MTPGKKLLLDSRLKMAINTVLTDDRLHAFFAEEAALKLKSL